MADRPAPWLDTPPAGHHFEAVPDTGWELDATRRCRADAGSGRKACGEPSAAVLWRAHSTFGRTRWAYCPAHMYGRWIEDGQIMHWKLAKDG